MPEQDEPMWPSADENSATAAPPEEGGDGEATVRLPYPEPTARPNGLGEPAAFTAPKITPATQSLTEQSPFWLHPAELKSPPAPRPDNRAPPRWPPHAVPVRIEPTGELHLAEVTTGADRELPAHRRPAEGAESTQPEKPSPEAPPKAKRKRRGLLLGGLVLLLVSALGITAALPQVANRLELPWAPNKPKGDAPQAGAATLVLHGPDVSSAAPTAAGVAKALKGPAGSAALGKLTGSVLDPVSGAILWDRDSGQPLTPASTTKLLTAAAALLVVDHGLRLSTKVVAGTQPGTVVLVGGGDPTLNSLPTGKDSLYPGSAHLDDLIAQVKKATAGEVKTVQLDVSAFAGSVTAPGWDVSDAPSTFAAPVVPVMLDGGRTDPNAEHSMRVANPATTAAQKLAQGLGAQAQGTVTAPPGAKVLGEVKSAPLTELVNTLLRSSDNALADAVARQTAVVKGVDPSFAGAAKATMDVLSQSGFDLTGVALFDGSGLSSSNRVPAKLLSQVLAAAAGPDGRNPRTAKLRTMIDGLPVAGGSGTLSTRYTDGASAAGKGWLRAKTGTLSGVNTLAGLVLDVDGRVLVFALMSSGGADQDTARGTLDAVAAALRGCGCR